MTSKSTFPEAGLETAGLPVSPPGDLGLRIERPKKNLRELVQSAMREAILDLRFEPGERLVERNLCAQLGVSRTVVREVLRFLEAEGLVEATLNGPVVARIKPEEAEQIYEIRAVLEGMAAGACAKLITPEDLLELGRAMNDLTLARDAADPQLSLKATNRFYQRVFAVSQKSVAWNVVEGLNVRINALRSMTIRTPERQAIAVAEMQRIYDAIARHDAEAARAAAIDHVEAAAGTARRLLSAPQDMAAESNPPPR
jgi:DNA-binding GntR family transcriptional regulator